MSLIFLFLLFKYYQLPIPHININLTYHYYHTYGALQKNWTTIRWFPRRRKKRSKTLNRSTNSYSTTSSSPPLTSGTKHTYRISPTSSYSPQTTAESPRSKISHIFKHSKKLNSAKTKYLPLISPSWHNILIFGNSYLETTKISKQLTKSSHW